MKNLLLGVAACAIATPALAAPNYTTSVTVAYDPSQADYTGNGFQSASNNSSYVVRTGIDSDFFYVDVTSTPNIATNTSLQFANIYIGGSNIANAFVIEATNHRAISTAPGSTYKELNGTGYTFSATQNDISFALPVSFLETDPLGIGFGDQQPGNLIRVSYAQAFGYSLVFGGAAPYNPTTRLGAQLIPTASGAVPEPASWAMMIAGLGAVGFAMRRRRQADSAVKFA